MSCQLELDGCSGENSVAWFHVKRFFAPGFMVACGNCWRQLVGAEREHKPEVKVNQPKLPSVPRRGAVQSCDLPLYAPPPKKPDDDWL